MLAVAFEVEAFEIEALVWRERLPDEGVEASRQQEVAGNLYSVGDDLLDGGCLALLARLRELIGDIEVLDSLIPGEHAQGSGIGGQLIIRVAEIGIFLL